MFLFLRSPLTISTYIIVLQCTYNYHHDPAVHHTMRIYHRHDNCVWDICDPLVSPQNPLSQFPIFYLEYILLWDLWPTPAVCHPFYELQITQKQKNKQTISASNQSVIVSFFHKYFLSYSINF